jgi:hypothetical protein
MVAVSEGSSPRRGSGDGGSSFTAPALAGVGNRSPRQPKLQHQPPAIKPTATPPPARPTPEPDTPTLQLRTSHDGRHLLRSASARWPRLLVQEYPHSGSLW